jgi:DNA helicase HerA-like ATPase
MMDFATTAREAVLRIGEVVAVEGRRIFILVDKRKNLSHVFLDGDILANISVNGYLDIRKGFLSIIGKVEEERIEEEFDKPTEGKREAINRSKRILAVALIGYIDEHGLFSGGTRELPLIGNEAFLMTREQLRRVHNLVRGAEVSVSFATIYADDLEFRLPVDGLFNSHIAIFGNTGSGKSNTLAALYQELVLELENRNLDAFHRNTKFLLFDFNGEFTGATCITESKTVYSLSTRRNDRDRLPLQADGLLDLEVLSILADATDKTQKPFLSRALKLLQRIRAADLGDPRSYFRSIVQRRVRDLLQMADKIRAFQVLDYFREILPQHDPEGEPIDLLTGIEWHSSSNGFFAKSRAPLTFFSQKPENIDATFIFEQAAKAPFGDGIVSDIIRVLYLQLISDILTNRAVNEHIAPVIFRLLRKRDDIERIFDLSEGRKFWTENFVVINLAEVNIDMRKTIPLLLAKQKYAEQKQAGEGQTLTIIIDEAHNILSTESFREAESWKDYRLETFEEIIKEGRKFGVFVTIASQRPNDISPTITSQAHNYFIHRLINDRDLATIASAVSYIDRSTGESIPTLATGTCIFSGVITPMPVKINIRPLREMNRPQSSTRKFSDIVSRR